MPERQRKRFFEGVYQAQVDGALWTFEAIEAARCTPEDVPKTLRRVVVAIDPSGTKGEEEDRSDDVGIMVGGLGDDGIGYCLADRTCQLPPEGWAKVAITAYHEFKADRIVAEGNFGGDMVRATIHAQDKNVPVELVTASRGKAVRAEPVSALYGKMENGEWEGGRVQHVGTFPEIEDQMMNFSTAGYVAARSAADPRSRPAPIAFINPKDNRANLHQHFGSQKRGFLRGHSEPEKLRAKVG